MPPFGKSTIGGKSFGTTASSGFSAGGKGKDHRSALGRFFSAALNQKGEDASFNKDYFKPSPSQQQSMDSFLGRINKPTGGPPAYKVRLDDNLSPPRGDVSGTMTASDSVAQPVSPEAQSLKRRTARQQASAQLDIGFEDEKLGV